MIVQAYSAIYGEYDTPKPVHQVGFTLKPVMFTESHKTYKLAKDAGWQPIYAPHEWTSPHGDPAIVTPMLNHKYWKCHPEGLYIDPQDQIIEASIWLDGSIEPHPGFEDIAIAALGNDDWSCVPHPSRACIYPEAYYSATLTWRYDAASILAQAEHYLNFHPQGWGLIATGVNIRRHTPEVIELSHLWWEEILNWSHQDQISLPVLMRLWEDKVKWNMNLTWHRDWILHPHG
jgi:hypothetical protein